MYFGICMEEAMTPQDGAFHRMILSWGQDLAGPHAIRRILISCAWFGGVVTLVAWVYLGWPWAVALAGGAAIGAANLAFLTALSQQVFAGEKRKTRKIVVLLVTKVLLVFGGLAALLTWDAPPIIGVVCGFSLVLVVITMKAIGRALLGTRTANEDVREETAHRDGQGI